MNMNHCRNNTFFFGTRRGLSPRKKKTKRLKKTTQTHVETILYKCFKQVSSDREKWAPRKKKKMNK